MQANLEGYVCLSRSKVVMEVGGYPPPWGGGIAMVLPALILSHSIPPRPAPRITAPIRTRLSAPFSAITRLLLRLLTSPLCIVYVRTCSIFQVVVLPSSNSLTVFCCVICSCLPAPRLGTACCTLPHLPHPLPTCHKSLPIPLCPVRSSLMPLCTSI